MQQQEKIDPNADDDEERFTDFDPHNYGIFAGKADDDYETDNDDN